MAAAAEKLELRRDVTVWGSYMWGYADVGADIYAALGLVMLWAKGATPLAFALAGLVYIMIGLAYTELAATYPVAGGGQYFTLRGLGDFWGFVAGSALLLDYTIDIALFATASAGYINFFLPFIFGIDINSLAISIGPLHHVNLVWMAEALLLVIFLIALNIRGMRESSLLNEVLGVIDILTESSIIIFGFLFAWRPEMLAHQWLTQFPTLKEFAYGSSLAIISFVGLESISQAAQETKRPATIVPRTSVSLIFTVFIFATAFSTMSLGVLPWQEIAESVGDPIATLAHAIPFIGFIAGPFAAVLGATILLISANSGVMSASRLTFAMSQFHFISEWFNAVHPRFRTPYRTIIIFSGIGILQIILSFLTPNAMDTLGNMYAFGATTGYILVFIALIKLRFTDPYSPRPYKVPLNIKINYRGRQVDFPGLAVLGTLGISTILFEVILTHAIGRIAGPAWVLLCFLYYAYYRRSKGYPVLGSIPRNWEEEQLKVLEAAEEYDLLEQYKLALAERDRKEAVSHAQ
ncbi:Amino acid permease [Neomoorella glycerini]|uniref:Amino acid permease n=1 Tax=Neomoorella glycerini TaxID=55779 RepID=A0A6I5ZV23_9FIRM|nr:amino acid permease [Moorella glycerini]QGP93724.1 Amino acid permease [Moorella glycerini]